MSQQNVDKSVDEKKPKAVALLSGGLDSSLAVRMMLEQGVEIEAVAIKTPFCDFDCGKGCGHRVKEVADELGIKLKTVYFGEEYLRMLKKPKYGYGSGMNPCIDCRAMMYNAANETGMEGKVLRPLSAKNLPPTDAEKSGLVKRENMGEIKGRSRKGQLVMAKHFGIAEPPNAAGGCLLTDPAFSKRVEDIMERFDDIPSLNDIELLKVGRHFRLTPDAKLVVGRNKDENEMIKALVTEGDIMIEAKDHVGPTCILRGKHDDAMVATCAAIALRYSDAPKDSESKVRVTIDGSEREVITSPADSSLADAIRI
ncbi:MAG: DUF814 domain-containing protein [Thaumarchaeota archaeon]|nr:MAG: DUF814 domain-containing protein [Nitrososphaerota archaeon]